MFVAALALSGTTLGPPSAAAAQSFTFSGSGWGHGVGMSQWGARGMAANGSSYAQILGHYYQGTNVASQGVNDDLRVLIAGSAPTLDLRTGGSTTFTGVGTVGAGQNVRLTRSGGSVRLSGALNATVAAPLRVSYAAGGDLTVSPPGYTYRYGSLTVTTDPAGGLRAVIGGLPMQQYLYGLGEMPSSWPTEALKAQATAGRTFAQKRIAARSSNADFDLYGSVYHQAYTGTKFQAAAWVAAVDATAGRVVAYGGGLIDALYSSSSGGHTENSEVVWVSSVPYLKGVPDPYDTSGGNPHASWSRTYSGDQLGQWFGLGTVTSVQVLGPLGGSGRVDKALIRLSGTGGTKDVKGASFRATVNSKAPSASLKSTRFTVGGSTTSSPPSAAPTPPAPNRPVSGNYGVATTDGRTVIVAGDANDPDGAPLVRMVSTMGRDRAVREQRANKGKFLFAWTGQPGTRNVCVTVYDTPTGAGTSLGCRDIVVK